MPACHVSRLFNRRDWLTVLHPRAFAPPNLTQRTICVECFKWRVSEMGQKQRFRPYPPMSALPPKAIEERTSIDVAEVPIASFRTAAIPAGAIVFRVT
jgi:hypothetical protein